MASAKPRVVPPGSWELVSNLPFAMLEYSYCRVHDQHSRASVLSQRVPHPFSFGQVDGHSVRVEGDLKEVRLTADQEAGGACAGLS